jgi:hypothetical protein
MAAVDAPLRRESGSLAANVAAANPATVSRLIAAWPSFAFVGAYDDDA